MYYKHLSSLLLEFIFMTQFIQFCMGIVCLFLTTPLLQAQRTKGQPHNYLSKTKTPNEIRAIENKIERIYYTICGEFSSKNFAANATDPMLAIEQEIIAVPIWTERKGEYWIYLGWFKHGEPAHPLMQLVLRLNKVSRDTFRLDQYLLPNPEAHNDYSLEWQKPHPFRDLKPKDLLLPEGCQNLMVEEEPNVFHLLSDDNPCEYYISDAVRYYDYECKFSPERLFDICRYFDKDKKFLFGYNLPEGVEFRRVDKTTPTYGAPTKRPAKNK